MSFIRTKTINGRQYKYLVTGVRQGDKVNQKVIKYLGPTDPKYRVGKKREKTNASIYVRDITTEEQSTLETATKNPLSFTRDRAKIILFSSQHLFARQISDKLSCDERKVRTAIKAFNKKGITSLERGKAPGARPKFTPAIKQVILLHYAKEPKEFDHAFTVWTLPRFRKHLIDYNVVPSISIEQLRQTIIQAGGDLKRSKRWQYSPDKEFEKKQRIEQVIACCPQNSVVLSFDEKGKTAIKQYGGQKYVFSGYYHIPYGQKVKGICDLFAARNIHTGKMHHAFFDWKNSFIVTQFLDQLQEEYPNQEIHIIWDGWSAHTSEHTKTYLDLHPRIKTLPLPTRASWLNPIERDFGQIQRFCLNNSNFQSVTEGMDAISFFIEKELSSN